MNLNMNFNARTVDPTQRTGSNLPVGKHPVVITDSEVRATNDGNNGLLALELTVIDGPSKGQTGEYRLNLYHQSSPKAVEIAQRQLSAICHVIGVYDVNDSQQLHGKPFIVEVALQKGEEAQKNGYTEVKKVYDINGNEPGKAGAGPGAAQPAQAAQGAPAGAGAWNNPGTAQQGAPGAGWTAPGAQGGGNAAGAGGNPAWGGGAGAGGAAAAPGGDKPAWAR